MRFGSRAGRMGVGAGVGAAQRARQGEHADDAGGNFMVDDHLVVFTDNIDSEFLAQSDEKWLQSCK